MRHDLHMASDFRHLADVLQAACAARGWLQEDLIRESEVGRSTIQRLWSGNASVMPNRTTRGQLERTFGWQPGSLEIVLAGGEPTLLSEQHAEAPRPAGTTRDSDLPVAVDSQLKKGALFDSEVVDLSRPGSPMHIVVVARVGTYDGSQEKIEQMREVWEEVIKRLHGITDLRDYRPGPDAPSDQNPSDRQ